MRDPTAIFLNNAFELGSESESAQRIPRRSKCICLAGSRFNHSCRPNATWKYNESTGYMNFHATKDIKKDDEIFIHYLSVTLPYARRKKKFAARWGFECACPDCKDHDAAACKDREAKRNELAVLKNVFMKYTRAGLPTSEAVQKHLEMLKHMGKLSEVEGFLMDLQPM